MDVVNKKRSFWQMLSMQPAQQEVTYYNPMKIGIGKVVTVNKDGFEGLDFRVANVFEYNRSLDGRKFVHTVYELVAKPIGREPVRIRLLANPIKGATAEDAYAYSLLLLKLDHEMSWDDSMTPVLEQACADKVWIVDDDGLDENGVQVREPYHDEYPRINDLDDPYEATVHEIQDEDGDGTFEPHEVRTRTVTYYDFARLVEDAPGVQNNEFYIVEKDGGVEDEGYITMWKGDETDPSLITVL